MADIVITGGTVVDGTGAPPRRADVVISGTRITEVVTVVTTATDAQRIDATGCTVMPGLIDAHTHVTLGEPASNDELFFRREPASAAIIAAYNVRKLLLAGVTSFLDADGLFNIGPALRECQLALDDPLVSRKHGITFAESP